MAEHGQCVRVGMTMNCSIILAIATALVMLAITFSVCHCAESKHKYRTFRPPKRNVKHETGEFHLTGEYHSFDSRHEQYLKVAEVVITLSSASLALLPTLHYSRIPGGFSYSMTLLGVTILFSVLFMALLSHFYEESLYDPQRYTAFRAAIVAALGFTSLICFAIAYLVLSIGFSMAFANGSITK